MTKYNKQQTIIIHICLKYSFYHIAQLLKFNTNQKTAVIEIWAILLFKTEHWCIELNCWQMDCIQSFLLLNEKLIFNDLSTNTSLIVGTCIWQMLVDVKSILWSLSLLHTVTLDSRHFGHSLVKCWLEVVNISVKI